MKRTILVAVLLIACILTATVGGTVAWFTDEVKTGANQIKAGNLDIELYNGDTKVDENTTNLFTYPTLWEPGAVAYANLSVRNEGDLALEYSMTLNTTDKNYVLDDEGDSSGLSLVDVLKVAVLNEAIDSATDSRAEVLQKAEAATSVALNKFSLQGELLAESDPDICTLVVYWPTTNSSDVDNQYNMNNDKTTTDGEPLYVNLAINLEATQEVAERDAFGTDYDASASFWAGGAGDASQNLGTDADDSIIIASAADLANFAAKVNTGTNYSGKTVKLTTNINLGNKQWTPIGTKANPFKGTFDGQGYTISNLYIDAPESQYVGLFGYPYGATFKGINVNNVDICGYSQVGTIVGGGDYKNSCIISDCHVSGKINLVSEYAYTGGIVGGNCYAKIENCSVIADGIGKIKTIGKTGTGGISGWLLEESSSITNCTVKNLELTGWANVGGITGFVHYNNAITGCTAESLTLTKTRVDGHPSIGLAAGGWSYNATKSITITGNTFKNITLNGSAVQKDSAHYLYGSEYYGGSNSNFVVENNTEDNIKNNLVIS